MKLLIYSLVSMFIVIASVQTRSLYNQQSDNELLKNYFLESPSYSDLLALLVNSQKHVHKKNGNDDTIYEPIASPTPEAYTTVKLGLFSPSTRPIRRRTRLFHSYGRKSHWDTFFG